MSVELDHIFVCVSEGAPEAARLSGMGLCEGPANKHHGQGTACRRFFFRNAYLELLWVCDAAEARSRAVCQTRLWDRWSQRRAGACPFGFGFRLGSSTAGRLPFRTWDYRPRYLPESMVIPVAANSERLDEPLLFFLSFGRRPDGYPDGQGPPLDHPAGLLEITRVEMTGPLAGAISPELGAVVSSGAVGVRPGPGYTVLIGFDGEKQGREADLGPELPIVLRW